MAAFFSAMQRVKFGSAAGRHTARARSKKIEFTGWALHGHWIERGKFAGTLSTALTERPKADLGSPRRERRL